MSKAYLRVINCCPHTVSVIEGSIYDPSIGKSRGGKEILRFPASGIVATAKSSVELAEPVEVDGIAIPTCKRSFSTLSDLPQEGDLYIVSSVFAQAAKDLGEDTSKLLSPYGTVVGTDGKVIGCTGLVRYA